jgi:heme-degrading monooxygenase HmoA
VDPATLGLSDVTRGDSRRAWDHAHVIVEHALLPVKAGQEAEFESAFGQAKTIIAGMPGFRSLTLSRCIERPDTYLLLVEWDRLEDHTEGFRGSVQYQRWREMLHHFYEPFPVVEHFLQVDAV